MPLHPEMLSLLVCPSCRAPLRPMDHETGLTCAACAVVYPVSDEIPLLLIEEAVPLADWEHGKRRVCAPTQG